MQAVVAGLKAEDFGGLSVVVVGGGDVGVVVVVVGTVPDVAPTATLASTSAAAATAVPQIIPTVLDLFSMSACLLRLPREPNGQQDGCHAKVPASVPSRQVKRSC